MLHKFCALKLPQKPRQFCGYGTGYSTNLRWVRNPKQDDILRDLTPDMIQMVPFPSPSLTFVPILLSYDFLLKV